MKKYLLGIDRGNSGIRAGLYDTEGNYLCGANIDIPLEELKPGQRVCKKGALQKGLYEVLRKAVENMPGGCEKEDIAGISFSMAGGMITGFDENGDTPLDTIFAGDVRRDDVFKAVPLLKKAGIDEKEYAEETSTTPPWILSDILSLKEKEAEKTSRIRKWTITEHSLAVKALGGTELLDPECGGSMHYNYNPFTRSYVRKIEEAVGIYEEDWLPMRYSGELCGTLDEKAAEETGLLAGTPLYVGMNDMIPLVLAQGAVYEGDAVANYGTFGTIGKRMDHPFHFVPDITSRHSLHVTGGGGKDDWQIGAIVSGCGASYSWLDSLFRQASESKEHYYEKLNALAEKSPIGAHGLVYSPFIIDGDAAFHHLSLQNDLSDIVRAVMEGIAYEMKESLEEVEKSIGEKVMRLFVSGGLTQSKTFLHILADMYGITIVKASVEQDMVGTKGAAMIAGIGAGIFLDTADAVRHMAAEKGEEIQPDEKRHQEYLRVLKDR